MKKRILSLLLAILMVVTSVPMFTLFAFAEEEKVPYDYDKLYVGSNEEGGLFFAMDFFSAKEGDAFTSTNNSTYSKFVTKSANSSITIGGGIVPQKNNAWTRTLTTSGNYGYPIGFVETGFEKNVFNDAYLIYKDASAAAGIENAIIYDATDDRFHASSFTYDFDNYNYYLLEGGDYIYSVNKSNISDRKIHGFDSMKYVNSTGYKASASRYGNGYFEIGLASALTTNINTLVRNKENNPDGDYTVELVAGMQYGMDNRNNNATLINDQVVKLSLNTYIEYPLNFYIYPYFKKGGSDHKPSQGDIKNYTITEGNTFAYICDMNTFTGAYVGNASLDMLLNNKLILGNGSYALKLSDTLFDEDGNRLHTFDARDISITSTTNMSIGATYSYGNISLYAFRVYDRTLTQAELCQNHFADVAKFYQLEMYEYDKLSANEKAMLHNALSSFVLTETTDTATKEAAQTAYNTKYLELTKTGNEAYDSFIARVMLNGFDLSAFSLLTKTQRESVIMALAGTEFTQDDIDSAVENAKVRVNTTTEDQYNSLYVQDGALLLSDFYSAKAGNYLTKGGSSNTKITYNGYYGYYEEDGSGNKVVKWKEVNTETISSATLYSGHSSNYTNYIHKTTKFKDATGADKTLALSGGSVHIPDEDIIITKLSSKKDNNVKPGEYVESYTAGNYDYYLYESTDALGNTSLYTLRVPKGSDLSAERTYEQYIVTTGALSNTYFQTSGYYSYESEFRDGYFSLGYVTGLSISNFSEFMKAGGVKSAESNGEEHLKYTLQVITALDTERWPDAGGSGAFMLSTTRANVSARLSNGQYKLQLSSISLQKSKADTNTPLLQGVYFDALASEPNEFTLGYDATFTDFSTSSSSGLTKGYMNFDMFLNGKLVDMRSAKNYTSAAFYDDSEADTSNTLGINIENTAGTIDTNFKLGENAALNIYAIRVYSKTLTLDEIRQNHFADLVKYNKVDVSNIFELKDSQKQEIYDIFADIKLTDKTTDELQAMYDEKFDDLYWSNFYEDGNDSHNHVIDLAYFYSLDLTVYNALPQSAKTALYEKTNAQTIDDGIFNSVMQATFDNWIEEVIDQLSAGNSPVEKINPLDLYIQEGLKYHISFLKAKGSGELFSAEVNGTTVYGTKDVFAPYVLYQAEGVKLYMQAAVRQADIKVDSKGYKTGAPILADGYLQLYSKEGDETIKRGVSLQNTEVMETTESFTQEIVVAAGTTGTHPLWIQPFMRMSIKSGTGISSVSLSRWGRQTWSGYPMAYTTLDPMANSFTGVTLGDDYIVTDAHTYTVVYARDLDNKTYTYDPADYGETGKAIIGTQKDSEFTANKIVLPEIEGIDGVTTLRTSIEHFKGAVIPMAGHMEVDGYVDGIYAFNLAEQPYTTTSGVYNLGTNYQQGSFNLYAMRVYSRDLSTEEMAQNHFADLAYKFDIELDIFALLNDDEKSEVYEAMTSCSVSDAKEDVIAAYEEAIADIYYVSNAEMPTENELHFYEVASYYNLDLTQFKKLSRNIQLIICDEFADTVLSEDINSGIIAIKLNEIIILQSDENFADAYASSLVNFEGYWVRKSIYPGIRSIYTINKALLETFEGEERGYTVTIGAMMGLANDGDTVRTSADLTMKKVNGEYVIDTTKAAFVEVYNSAREDADENGFVASYWQEKEDVYHMAFTTTYEKADSQTVDMYNTELIYGAYVILEKEGEEDKIFYIDTNSKIFGGSASLYEVSSTLKEINGDAYSMVQKVLNETDGTDFVYGKIAGVELPDFTFVYDADDEVFATELIKEMNEIIEAKLGVKLASKSADNYAGEHGIHIVEREDLEDANYGVYVEGGNLYLVYDYAANAYYAMSEIMLPLLSAEGNIIIGADYKEMGSVPTYKVVMLGASNVAVSDVFQVVDTYLQTQYGNVSIELLNAGRSGGTISSALNTYNGMYDSRVQREVYAQNPDAVVLQFIFNALGSSGVITNSKDLTIERIWNGNLDKYGVPTSGAEVDVDTLFVDGEFIGIDKMKEMYPNAFTTAGRVKFTTVTYKSDADFNEAFKDVENSAIVKYTVDKSFSLDLTDKENNHTNYTKFIYDLEALIADFTARGIDVILPTPVDYDEQLVNATGTSERIIGLKYTWADVDNYMKTVLAKRDGVAVVDYFSAQLELKAQLQENGADGSLMKSDRKHYKGMEGPYAVGTTFMTDLIGKSLVLDNDASRADTLITDYVAKTIISANGTVNANNATVTDFAVLDNGVTFSYKPHGVSMAQIETLVQMREALGKAKYEDTAKYAENPNKEIFKIEGLQAEATYSITIGGKVLAATYTGAELANGVDISLDKNNPSAAIASKIVDQLYIKRTNLAKLRSMAYVRETELFKAGVDDSVATREEIFAVLDKIIAEKPDGNYAKTSAKSYKEYYDIQEEFSSTVNLCDYKVKKLLDFDAYTVTITEVAE